MIELLENFGVNTNDLDCEDQMDHCRFITINFINLAIKCLGVSYQRNGHICTLQRKVLPSFSWKNSEWFIKHNQLSRFKGNRQNHFLSPALYTQLLLSGFPSLLSKAFIKVYENHIFIKLTFKQQKGKHGDCTFIIKERQTTNPNIAGIQNHVSFTTQWFKNA